MLLALRGSIERLGAADAARVCTVVAPPRGGEVLTAISAVLPTELDRLFSVERGRWSGLDVVVFADLVECTEAAPAEALSAVLQCLETVRSGLVRTRGPASERGLSCHAVFTMPAPSDPHAGSKALATLRALESWHRSVGSESPLGRVFCWPTRGQLGVYSGDELSAILCEFLEGTFLAGARASDRVRSLLDVPDPREGRVAVLSASALSLSVRRVERYLELRLVLLALEAARRSIREGAHGPEHEHLLRDAALERLTSEGDPKPFEGSVEVEVEAALDGVDAWLFRRVGPQMGLDRALEVQASLESAAARAAEHARRLSARAVALDAEPGEPTPRAITERGSVPRWLVAPLAGSLFSATAALGCALAPPRPDWAYLWAHLLLPATLVSVVSVALWLFLRKALELKSHVEAEREAKGEHATRQASERRAGALADELRFTNAVRRGLGQRVRSFGALVQALDDCVVRFRSRLAELDVAPGETPDEDRIDQLLPPRGRRITGLCTPTEVARLVRVPDLADWVRRVLLVALPESDQGRFVLERAFSDDARLTALASELAVLQRLRDLSPFEWVRAMGVGPDVGRWLENEVERSLPTHDLSAATGAGRTLLRHRLVLGPVASQHGSMAAFNVLSQSGWSYVPTALSHPSLLVVDVTVGVFTEELAA
jgi:hypothetical protein